MSKNEVIGLSAELKVEQALAELRKLGPGADKEARAISASLGRALKDSERAAKKLSDELRRAGQATSSGGLDKAAKALGPLGGVLAKISPEAGSAAASIAGLTGAAEGFAAAGLGASVTGLAVAMGALSLAVGAAYVGWRIYTEESDRAAVSTAEVAKASKGLEPLLLAQRMAALDAAEATGEMSSEAATLERQGVSAMRAYAGATASAAEQIKAIRAEQGSWTRQLADWSEGMREATGAFGAWNPLLAAVDGFTESTSEAEGRVSALTDVEREAAAMIKSEREERAKATAVKRGHSAATADATTAALAEARAQQDALQAALAADTAMVSNRQAADAMIASSIEARLSDVARLQLAEDRAAASYVLSARAGGAASVEIERGVAELRAGYQEQITAKVEAEAARRRDAEIASAKEIADAQAASTAQAIGRVNEVGGYAMQALGMVSAAADAAYVASADTAARLTTQLAAGEQYYTDAQEDQLKIRIDAAKDAARKQFAAAKAAKIAEATASTALAAINAIAQSPPPSPFGLIGAGIAGAAGAVAVSQIAATEPTFHQGYAPDEQRARVMTNEAVMSPTATAMLGQKKIQEMNSGKGDRGYAGPAPVIIGHRVMDDLIKRELVSGGALAAALAPDSASGHRINRRGVTG